MNGKYQNATKLLDKARQWPERLGVGKPFDVDNRFEDYLVGVCALKSGDKARSQELFQQVAAYTRSHAADQGVNRLFGALAGKALGHESASTKLVDQWSADGKSPAARWLMSVVKADNAEAAASERELKGASTVSLLGRASVDQDLALLVEVFHSIKF